MSDGNRYEQLQTEIEALKQLADQQTHHYRKSTDLLYEGLSRVYLLWCVAAEEEGLLDRLYDEYNIQYKRITKFEVVFSPLLRYLWGADAVGSNTVDQWNRALNQVHIEVQNKREYYKENTLNKLVAFIRNAGGIINLAGYGESATAEDDDSDGKKKLQKAKLTPSAELKLGNAHLQKGKAFFATDAHALANFKLPQTLPAADSGFTLALLRKTADGYEVLSAIDDKGLVDQAVVASYRRTSKQMPNTARLLTEIIRTQSLPSKIAALAPSLVDNSKYKAETTGETMKQLKRLLYVGKDGNFVLSANRSECSVVTIAMPRIQIFNTTDDIALAVGDRTYIENKLIYTGDFNFYSADSAQLVPAIEGEPASHKLKLENTVTKQFRFVRFYRLSSFKFPPSKTQVIIKSNLLFKPTYCVTLDQKWLGEMRVKFLQRWVNGLGSKIKRAEYNMMSLAMGKTCIAFKHTYKGGEYKENEIIDFDKATASGVLQVNVLSKDIVPVLNALTQMEIVGNVTLQADEKMVGFSFTTDCADYRIAIPCCTPKGKRIGNYFEAYGA